MQIPQLLANLSAKRINSYLTTALGWYIGEVNKVGTCIVKCFFGSRNSFLAFICCNWELWDWFAPDDFPKVKVQNTYCFTHCYTELIQACTYCYNLVYNLGFSLSLRLQAALVPGNVSGGLNHGLKWSHLKHNRANE